MRHLRGTHRLWLTVAFSLALAVAGLLTDAAAGSRRRPAERDFSLVGPAKQRWQIQCARCPDDLLQLGDRSLVLDGDGHPHLAYVGDAVYYAWYDGASWHSEPVGDAPGQVYGFFRAAPALALDSQGRPHLAYLDAANRAVLHAYQTGEGDWQIQTVESAPPQERMLYDTALALDQQDRPQVSFFKSYTNLGILRHARWTGSEWQVESVDWQGWNEMSVSLALDGTGAAHISYYHQRDPVLGGRLKYAHSTAKGWEIEVVDESTWLGEFNSIAVDSKNVPHISYFEYTNGQVRYAHRTGGDWQTEVVDVSDWWGGFTSIALDSAGEPHLSYTTQDGQARYAHRSGGAWQIQDVADAVWFTSIALDSGSLPHLAYFSTADRSLETASWNENGWQVQTVDQPREAGWSADLALDGEGHPHLGYVERGGPPSGQGQGGSLCYAYWDTSWHAEAVDAIGAGGGYASVALDGAGLPHVAYYAGTSDDLRYAHWDGGHWITQTVDWAGDVGTHASLALDKGGRPSISYQAATEGTLRYAELEAGGWLTSTVTGSGGTASFTSLAMDGTGAPVISYYDASSGDLRLARRTGGGWSIEAVDSDGDVGAYSALALDDAGRPHISYYDASHGDLKHAQWTADCWAVETVDSAGDVGRYTSLVLGRDGGAHISYYDQGGGGLRYAHWTGSEWVTETVQSGQQVGLYTSLALDARDRPRIAYYDGSSGDLRYAVAVETILYLPLIGRAAP
jgi:hypothetical protein